MFDVGPSQEEIDPSAVPLLASAMAGTMTMHEDLQAENARLKDQLAALEGRLGHDDLRGAILQMPALIVLLRGKDHIVDLPNQPWLDGVGRGPEAIGKPLREVLPELEGQGLMAILDNVLATGETFVASRMPVALDLKRSGVLEQRWFTFQYIAHRGKDNQPIGVLVHAADVSDEVMAEQKVQKLSNKMRTFFALAENAPDGITVTEEGRIIYANPAFRSMVGRGEECVGMAFSALVAEGARPPASSDGVWQGVLTYRRADGSQFPGQASFFAIRGDDGKSKSEGGITRDLTEALSLEQERERLQAEVIATQERAIRELSSPLIPVAEGVVVMPLVGSISDARAGQIMETLLHGIAAQRARIAILDVTGLKEVDGGVARGLLRTAQAAGLLGTEVVLTGIGPVVAQTLVAIGADFGSLKMHGTLQSAVAYAMGKSARPLA